MRVGHREREQHMIVAFENEPFPNSPIGISMSIKLSDWLDLAHALPEAHLDIRPVAELRGDFPDIVEAFATQEAILGPATFPTLTEHPRVVRHSALLGCGSAVRNTGNSHLTCRY